MAYGDSTPKYQIPIIEDGEILTSSDERIAMTIIENQIRAGILGAGGNRVYREGSYTVRVDAQNRTTVVLLGNPSVQGICNDGLVESSDAVTWSNLAAGATYYLYITTTSETYLEPSQFNPIASTSLLTTNNYLLLATINTTGATPSSLPTVNTTPPEKATAFNLFSLVNSNSDPFGPSLSQTILTVLSQFTVYLGADKTALFSQLHSNATLPVISIENFSAEPEIQSGQELRLADSRLTSGFALTDSGNPAFLGVAESIIGALNEILRTLQSHISQSQDPHGETLTQTNLVLTNYLQLPRLEIHPPLGPPSPPGSPPGPPPTIQQDCEIKSIGRLKFCDGNGSITLTETGETTYQGEATSIIGALNELLTLIVTLTTEINNINGTTQTAISPIILEVTPDEVGQPLHFRIVLSEDDTFSVVDLAVDSSESPTNWYYERHILPPAPPTAPPLPPHYPFPIKSDVTEPSVAVWSPLPVNGLAGPDQRRPDGNPTLVQYRPQSSDGLYLRRKYNITAQQNNLEYGEPALGTIVFG